eukprot:scaffold166929_cov18-Prasinocladus_malaysianus.AAC.1
MDAWQTSDDVSDDANVSNGDDDRIECQRGPSDSYLRVPEMDAPTWSPLKTYLMVPRLPKE